MKKFIPGLMLFLCVVVSAGTEEIVRLEKPRIYPDSEENRAYIERVVLDAAVYIEKLYGGKLRLAGIDAAFGKSVPPGQESFTGKKVSFTLDINAVNQESKVISLEMTRLEDGEEANTMPYTGPWEEGVGGMIGRFIYYQWASFYDFAVSDGEPPAVYVDEFAADRIPSISLPMQNLQLYPYSLAVRSNGNLIVGANSIAIEMDRKFRILSFPGKSLVEGGNWTYAYGVDITPGGTLYFKPSTGSDLYTLIPGAGKPRRIRTGMSGPAHFGVLPDGRTVLADAASRRAVLLDGRRKTDLDLFTSEYSYIMGLSIGPDGNIWVKDTMEKHILIYSPEGILLDSILPLTREANLSGVRAIAVYRNGDFILLSQSALMKFRRNGERLWQLDMLPSPDQSAFTTVMDIAIDSASGMIYLTDYAGRRIYKLMDPAVAAESESSLDFEYKLIEMNNRLADDPYDVDALQEKALLYEEAGAIEAAINVWEQLLDADPFGSDTEGRLETLELKLLKNRAEQLRVRTLEQLDTLGPESARSDYRETVQVYEKIFSISPDDHESRRELQQLQETFEGSRGPDRRDAKPLQIVSTRLDRLFPSLLQYYRLNPAGTVTVTNGLKESAENLKATLMIKEFMDYPAETESYGTLKPSESVTIELPVQFNRSIFSLEEDLPVQVLITLEYTVDGDVHSVTASKTVTLYKRTALSWDDSRKLAAFIMPNEEIVSQFAHRVISSQQGDSSLRFSRVFIRAATLVDAVGAYGIEYIEDPASPITAVLENENAIDTVRFPRTTLYYRSGDCDDSTALLCSLFESAGIHTAIMTSPGHVFLAFDTGEPASNRWQYSSPVSEVIEHNGTLWIPLEATIIHKGFFASWQEASKLVRRYSDNEVEFLPVGEAWKLYPSLPLPESAFTIVEPPAERVDRKRSDSIAAIKQTLYEGILDKLSAEQNSGSSRRRARSLNQIGILHARYGEDGKAEELFNEAMNVFPGLVSSYINMANLKLIQEKPEDALEYLEQGHLIKPDSLLLNALLAKTCHRLGRQSEAEEYYTFVEKSSPATAENLAYIRMDGSGAVSRASEAASSESFFWETEE